MENPADYALTTDDEVLTMLETARQSLLVMGAAEIEFCLRFLVNIAKGVHEATDEDVLVGEDPHDMRYIEEAMSARDRGIENIARACGGFSQSDVLGAAAIKSLVAFVPMTPAGDGWADVDGAVLRQAYARATSGELLSYARSLYELTGPTIAREYALEVLSAA